MKKIYIDPISQASAILNCVKNGVLLSTKANGDYNTMTISWGTLGIQWNTPVFIAFVRGCRHTKPRLDQSGCFTVNIALSEADKNILKICGTKSGRDMNKFHELGLHVVSGETVDAPAIKEFPLTLECKIVYAQQQTPDLMLEPHLLSHYPKNSNSIEQDYHTAFYGEILKAYILEDE